MTLPATADFLPGLLYLAVATLAAWALRRLGERLPVVVVLVGIAIPAWLFAPSLWLGWQQPPFDNLRGYPPFEELSPADPPGNPIAGDRLLLTLPSAHESRRRLVAGRWPLVSDRIGSGMPLLADPQAQALQPIALVSRLLPAAQAAATQAALGLAIASLLTFCFLRRQETGTVAAAAGGAAWALGGFVFLWTGWPISTTAIWLPAVLLAIARCFELGGRREIFVTAAALVGLALAGHPETLVYALAVALLFTLARARRAPRDERRGALTRLAAGAALAAALTAPAWLPTGSTIGHSLRAARLAEAPVPAVESFAQRAITRLVPIASPNTFGNSRYAAYWGRTSTPEDAAGFVGTVTLLAALAALLGMLLPGEKRRRPEEGLFAGLGVATLVFLALPPGLYELLRLSRFGWASDYHHRLLLVVSFALVYLAACAIDRLARDHEPKTATLRDRLFAAVPWLGGGAALAALLVWSYSAHGDPTDPGRLDIVRYGWLLRHLRILVVALAVALVPTLITALRPTGRIPGRRYLPLGLVLLIVVELTFAHRLAHPPSPQRLALPEPLVVRALKESADEVPDLRIAALGRALPPNLAALYGLSDVRIYNPLVDRRYAAVLGATATGWEGESALLGNARPEVLDLLGVDRLLVMDPSGRAQVRSRPNALGAIYLPRATEPLPAGDLAAILADSGSFIERSWVGDGTWSAEGSWAASSPTDPAVVAGRGAASGLWADLSLPEQRLVATGRIDDGGWRLLVDGRRRATFPVNGAFVGAWVPAGRHRVELVYRPPGFALGLGLAALGLAAALAFVARPAQTARAAKSL